MKNFGPTPRHPMYEEYTTQKFVDNFSDALRKWETKTFILATSYDSRVNQLMYKRGVAYD